MKLTKLIENRDGQVVKKKSISRKSNVTSMSCTERVIIKDVVILEVMEMKKKQMDVSQKICTNSKYNQFSIIVKKNRSESQYYVNK